MYITTKMFKFLYLLPIYHVHKRFKSQSRLGTLHMFLLSRLFPRVDFTPCHPYLPVDMVCTM